MAYHTTRSTMLEMFVDNTAGESTTENRLLTREAENGNVALIAYGWIKVAEYNESREAVTVFTGHMSIRSKTVARWLNQVVSVAERRGRDVIISGESPSVDTPNDSVKYVNNYISMRGDKSPVEKAAEADVVDDLKHLA